MSETTSQRNASSVTAAALEAALRAQFAPTMLEVVDESYQHLGHQGANDSGLGTHFRVRIDCPAFAGLSKVARHRLVYDCLRPFFSQGLHALAIQA